MLITKPFKTRVFSTLVPPPIDVCPSDLSPPSQNKNFCLKMDFTMGVGREGGRGRLGHKSVSYYSNDHLRCIGFNKFRSNLFWRFSCKMDWWIKNNLSASQIVFFDFSLLSINFLIVLDVKNKVNNIKEALKNQQIDKWWRSTVYFSVYPCTVNFKNKLISIVWSRIINEKKYQQLKKYTKLKW